ncbi:hypothetical protein [Bacteroides sedimenti]|uniref:Uncharacterized protein n=1 Tax=Bacteroides sedimenti TaxID=2136147 RepID=A0ABN6YZZ9_9BACE
MKQTTHYTQIKQYFRKSLTTLLALFLITISLNAQNQGSYSDYLKYALQKIPAFKTFHGEDSIPHYFLQLYTGPSYSLVPNPKYGLKHPGLETGLALGKWFTPIHGARVGLFGRYYKFANGKRTSEIGTSLDYLMNFSALAGDFNAKRKFELVGVAGGEYFFPPFKEGYNGAWGIRTGLQARLAAGYGNVFFMEPRIGIYSDNMDFMDSWRGYNIAGSLVAGVEFRSIPRNIRSVKPFSSSTFKENSFLFSGLGLGGQLVPGGSDMSNFVGGSFFAGAGRWFSPLSGARLTGMGAVFKYPVTKYKVSTIGAMADYLFNVSNAFYGYEPNRTFSLIATGGAGYQYVKSKHDKNLFVLGAGMQASLRLNDEMRFFVEPRLNFSPLDYYTSGTNDYRGTRSNFMVNAGLELYANPMHIKGERNRLISESWLDNTFVGLTFGANSPLKQAAFFKVDVDPRVGGYLGKWFTGTSGVRLSADVARLWKSKTAPNGKIATISADYLLNISSLMNGYDPQRSFELIGVAGANLAFRSTSLTSRSYLGGELALQGLWNLTPSFGIFLEPQMRLYGNRFSESNIRFAEMDCVAALMTGINVRLNNCTKEQRTLFKKEDKNHKYFTLSAGTAFLATHIRRPNAFGISGQMAMGNWINPVAGWRIGVSGEYKQEKGVKYVYAGTEADYMVSLSTMALGYDPERRINLNAFAGVNVGLDYERSTMGFAPGISAGGQLLFKASSTTDFFVEPKLTVRSTLRNNPDQAARGMMNVHVGMNYKFSSENIGRSEEFKTDEHYKYFVSATLGAGGFGRSYYGKFYSKNVTGMFGAAVGKRVTPVSYLRFGVNGKSFRNAANGDKVNVAALNADYLMNLSVLGAGYDKDRKLELLGVLGGTLNFASSDMLGSSVPLGVKAGLQGKLNLSPRVDLTMEPTMNWYNKPLDGSTARRGKASAEVYVGVNYKF